jgi:putative membrane protein insertion efficiency factor
VAQVPPRTLAARSLLGLLKVYKLLLSPLFAGSCRFHPSCADYSAEAIRTHGAIRGVGLTLVRLSKCRPLGQHGFDPVPSGAARTLSGNPAWRRFATSAGRPQYVANQPAAGSQPAGPAPRYLADRLEAGSRE